VTGFIPTAVLIAGSSELSGGASMLDNLTSPIRRPYIVGIGGTTRANSSTEKALKVALQAAEVLGAETVLLGAQALDLPMYAPEGVERSAAAKRFVEEVRRADGVIMGSPVWMSADRVLLAANDVLNRKFAPLVDDGRQVCAGN
jgi:hypothetical protein